MPKKLKLAKPAAHPFQEWIDGFKTDLQSSLKSDSDEIKEFASGALKATAKALKDYHSGKIDSQAMSAIFDSYWRANRSLVSRMADRTARRSLLTTVRAMFNFAAGLTGGLPAMATQLIGGR